MGEKFLLPVTCPACSPASFSSFLRRSKVVDRSPNVQRKTAQLALLEVQRPNAFGLVRILIGLLPAADVAKNSWAQPLEWREWTSARAP